MNQKLMTKVVYLTKVVV